MPLEAAADKKNESHADTKENCREFRLFLDERMGRLLQERGTTEFPDGMALFHLHGHARLDHPLKRHFDCHGRLWIL
jgi:hypothetical protein